MKTYNPVETWAWQVQRDGRRFKTVASRWRNQGFRNTTAGQVTKHTVASAAMDLAHSATRAWREALDATGAREAR